MSVDPNSMALIAGDRLGHYDVTSLLGEGGMGQVWQATDTQLNRHKHRLRSLSSADAGAAPSANNNLFIFALPE